MGSRPKIYYRPDGSIYPTLSKTTYCKEKTRFGQSVYAILGPLFLNNFRKCVFQGAFRKGQECGAVQLGVKAVCYETLNRFTSDPGIGLLK